MKKANIISQSKLSTQAIFLVCGFAISSPAPKVQLANERLCLNDDKLGFLLSNKLCFNLGGYDVVYSGIKLFVQEKNQTN